MTKEEYTKLLREGQNIFMKISKELNPISDTYIREEKGSFRREIDFNEMCIALALAQK